MKLCFTGEAVVKQFSGRGAFLSSLSKPRFFLYYYYYYLTFKHVTKCVYIVIFVVDLIQLFQRNQIVLFTLAPNPVIV